MSEVKHWFANAFLMNNAVKWQCFMVWMLTFYIVIVRLMRPTFSPVRAGAQPVVILANLFHGRNKLARYSIVGPFCRISFVHSQINLDQLLLVVLFKDSIYSNSSVMINCSSAPLIKKISNWAVSWISVSIFQSQRKPLKWPTCAHLVNFLKFHQFWEQQFPPGYSFYFALDFRADNVAAFFDNFLIGKWPVVVSCMLDWRKKFVDASNTWPVQFHLWQIFAIILMIDW